MPLRFRIELRNTKTGDLEVCEGTIPAEDWALMDAFRSEAGRLAAAEWVRAGLDRNYKMTWERGRPPVVDWPGRPSDAAIAELLHKLRPFLLQNESLYFPRVTGRMWVHFSHVHLRAQLEKQRRGFDHGYGRAFYQLSVAPTVADVVNDAEASFVINDARTFGLWLNAFEYHRDSTKRDELLRGLGNKLDELTVATFLQMVADKAAAVLDVTEFLDGVASAPSAQLNVGNDNSEQAAL